MSISVPLEKKSDAGIDDEEEEEEDEKLEMEWEEDKHGDEEVALETFVR